MPTGGVTTTSRMWLVRCCTATLRSSKRAVTNCVWFATFPWRGNGKGNSDSGSFLLERRSSRGSGRGQQGRRLATGSTGVFLHGGLEECRGAGGDDCSRGKDPTGRLIWRQA